MRVTVLILIRSCLRVLIFVTPRRSSSLDPFVYFFFIATAKRSAEENFKFNEVKSERLDRHVAHTKKNVTDRTLKFAYT